MIPKIKNIILTKIYMPSTRILTSFPAVALERVTREVEGARLVSIPEQGALDPEVRGEVLLTPPWDTGNLALALERGVRWVHTIGTGVDRFPFPLLGGRPLTCARGASSIPVSEWVIACMLNFEKRMPEIWIDSPPDAWSGAQLGTLQGRTLGLVGLGGIGEAVARHALGFGMRVCAFRRSGRVSPIEGVEVVGGLSELLGMSDHCVLALPLTPDSRHVIDAKALSAIPEGAGVHLVNISRGGLLDQDALRDALNDGRIRCASLDVCDPEPLPAGDWLYSHPGVRLSPHNSWNTPAAFDLLLDTFIDNLRRYRAGKVLDGIVDIEAGY